LHGAFQDFHVSGRHERRVGAVNDLGYATDVGGEERHARRGRFQDNVGHAFGPRRDNQAAAEREGSPRRHRPGEGNETAETELVGE